MQKQHLLFASAFLMLAVATTSAQTTATASASAATPDHKTINERKNDQQERIAQGLKSGKLTATEAAALESQEAGINKEEAGMRAQDDGHLTAQDKATLRSQLNTESKDIYADKHDGSTPNPAPKGEVNRRIDNQQDRIAAGDADHDLTATQTAKLETQEAGIEKEEATMRAGDDGKLTAADRKELNEQLDRESRRIRRDERRTEHRR